MDNATVKEALNHPRWSMGPKVTIDSATMMNKGLEMIEAHWLFGIDPNKVEIVIHPQSIIHSMAQFSDGSVTAQLSVPDMRLPIQYALTYPYRVELNTQRIDFAALGRLDFFAPDFEKFQCLRLAYNSVARGGNIPCAMNAANEVAVDSFLRGEISLGLIPRVIEEATEMCSYAANPVIEDIIETDKQSREYAKQILIKHKRYN